MTEEERIQSSVELMKNINLSKWSALRHAREQLAPHGWRDSGAVLSEAFRRYRSEERHQ